MTRRSFGRCRVPVARHAEVRSRLTPFFAYAGYLTGVDAFVIAVITHPRGIAMTRNIGPTDKVLRIIVGLVLLALVFVGPKTPLGYFGVIPLLTGLTGFCPLYTLFGISTCSRDKVVTG